MKKIVLLSAMIAALFLSQSAFAQKQCGIVAHRGFWNCEEAGYAKNSIAALRCAQEAGFWGSEFDVNMTSDGVLIVYHDSDVKGKKHYMTASGDIHEGTILKLKEVKLGDAVLKNIEASVVHSQKAPLLLGQSVLEKFGTITIDNVNSKLIIKQ